MSPKLIVLNLSHGEKIPQDVQTYLDLRHVEIQYVENTKVYKKIIPTLKKYPNDCVICIDDDWIYPSTMIEDFMFLHLRYPNHPISGNKVVVRGLQCHCGCASMLKAEYFGKYLQEIDNDVIEHCASSDIVYTYLATLNGYPYICTRGEYFVNMNSYNSNDSYSASKVTTFDDTFVYLESRFGPLPIMPDRYCYEDREMHAALHIIEQKIDEQQEELHELQNRLNQIAANQSVRRRIKKKIKKLLFGILRHC